MELDAHLDHNAANALPSLAHAIFTESLLVDGNGVDSVLCRSNTHQAGVEVSAGNWDLRPDDVDRRLGFGMLLLVLGELVFAGCAQAGTTAGAGAGEERGIGVVRGHTHGGVQMNLGVAGCNAGTHKRLCLLQGGLLLKVRPGQRAQVVAAKEHVVPGNALLTSQVADEGGKVRRCHAGIAAILVHLVGSGLDESHGLGLAGAGKHSTDNVCVGRAARVDAGTMPLLVLTDDLLKDVH